MSWDLYVLHRDTPIDLATYETENKEDPDEEPDKLFLSHTLTHGFARIPRPVQHRLVYFAKEQKTNIKKVIETIPEAVNLFCRYPWATPKYEAAIETVPYSEEELVPILCIFAVFSGHLQARSTEVLHRARKNEQDGRPKPRRWCTDPATWVSHARHPGDRSDGRRMIST